MQTGLTQSSFAFALLSGPVQPAAAGVSLGSFLVLQARWLFLTSRSSEPCFSDMFAQFFPPLNTTPCAAFSPCKILQRQSGSQENFLDAYVLDLCLVAEQRAVLLSSASRAANFCAMQIFKSGTLLLDLEGQSFADGTCFLPPNLQGFEVSLVNPLDSK